jgi:uncharacterized protein (DUF433 family)
MQLEDYFDFLAPDDIRIKGHRIGIETVLDEHLRKGRRPEEIVVSYPSLGLDEVYATILYYLRNREAIDRYLADWREFGREARERQRRDPPRGIVRLRQLTTEPNAGGRPA